jgi:sigma-B regulation protein RsbU (phosphoserine phosphatase)
MAGLDLCAWVRAAHFPWYTYLLLLTSERREDKVVEGIEAGADGVAMKPLREAELRACMKAGERILSVESHLQEQNQKLSQAYATIRQDLEAAAEVQRSLLPTETLVIPRLQFAWVFRPYAFVAGDLFNYFRLDETHVGFYLLDVAGHGVAAAMQSVTLGKMLSPMPSQSNLVKCYTPHPPYYAITSPEEVVRGLNQQFQAATDTMQ